MGPGRVEVILRTVTTAAPAIQRPSILDDEPFDGNPRVCHSELHMLQSLDLPREGPMR